MKKALLWLLALVLVTGAVAGGLTGYFFWKFAAHVPEADYSAPKNTAEARLQDLDYLRKLPEVDHSFSDEQKTAFAARIDALEAQVRDLSDEQFLMELAAAAATSENGHTGASRKFLFQDMASLPVRFHWFADGLFIVRAREEHANLIGRKVLRYGGSTPEELITAIDPYEAGNAEFLRYNSASFLAIPTAMHSIGAIEAADAVTLELADADGTIEETTLTVEAKATPLLPMWSAALATPHEREADSASAWQYLAKEPVEATWFGRNPDMIQSTDTLPDGGVYWRLRDIFGTEEQNTASWLEEQAAKLRAKPADYLVLDLRANLGGNYLQSVDVMKEIAGLVTEDGRIYILTDNATFSAGIVTAALALAGGGDKAVMVGENMGDFSAFWAEGGGPMVLPNSKMPIYVSTGYHDWENGCDEWSRCFWPNVIYGVAAGPLEVDIPAPLLFSDYIKGVDTGMEAVFAAEAAR